MHTPGPWKIRRSPARLEGGGKLAFIEAGNTNEGWTLARVVTHTDEDEANVRLIQAAPDLLEAAKKVLARQAAVTVKRDAFVVNTLRAAIAKAEGR